MCVLCVDPVDTQRSGQYTRGQSQLHPANLIFLFWRRINRRRAGLADNVAAVDCVERCSGSSGILMNERADLTTKESTGSRGWTVKLSQVNSFITRKIIYEGVPKSNWTDSVWGGVFVVLSCFVSPSFFSSPQ